MIQPRQVVPTVIERRPVGRPRKSPEERRVARELKPPPITTVINTDLPIYLKLVGKGRGCRYMTITKTLPIDWRVVEVFSQKVAEDKVILTVRKVA